jgi:hypothetical protein
MTERKIHFKVRNSIWLPSAYAPFTKKYISNCQRNSTTFLSFYTGQTTSQFSVKQLYVHLACECTRGLDFFTF